MGGSPDPLRTLPQCLARTESDMQGCYDDFMENAPNNWGLPRAPADLTTLKDRQGDTAAAELDTERFLANAQMLGSSLAVLEKLVGAGPLPDSDVRQGLASGARRAVAYLTARTWHRNVTRPTTAIVLSGGAANGAFSAGFIWRLMELWSACRVRPAQEGGCPGASIDLVTGTSTGALVGLVVDMYGTPGLEAQARDLLIDSFTCSVNASLYCVNNRWDWALLQDLKGLVRFDGLEDKITKKVPPTIGMNNTERVAVTVDLNSGDIYGLSDQDPEDRGDPPHQIAATMASSVRPVMAEPIAEIPHDGGSQQGTFVDGGIRSVLPVREAVNRGAERVLILSPFNIEPDRVGPPKNLVKILQRTLEVLAYEPRVAELQEGELLAVDRRFVEYNVCRDRLLDGKPQIELEPFCRRETGFYPEPNATQGAPPTAIGPSHFPQVASSWRSEWVFRPEEKTSTAIGYSFDPEVMRTLFELGARTFQRRCRETVSLFGLNGMVADGFCKQSEDEVVAAAQQLYTPCETCEARLKEVRLCRR
jgi:predicted acylesterase/phospholipase RssA